MSVAFVQTSITLAPTAITVTFVPTTVTFEPQLLLHQSQWICTSHNYFFTNLIFQRDSFVDQVSVFQGTFWTEQGWPSSCLEDGRVSKWQPPCLMHHAVSQGRPRWLSGREPTCQCRRRRFDPWVRKIPWRREWRLIPTFLPGKCHGQRSRQAAVHKLTKSQTRLSNKTTTTLSARGWWPHTASWRLLS